MVVRSPQKTILVIGPGPRRVVGKDQFAHAVVNACLTFTAQGHKVVLLDNAPYLALPGDAPGIQRRIEPLTPEVVRQVVTDLAVNTVYADAGGSVAQWLGLTSRRAGAAWEIDHIGTGPRMTAAALSRSHLFAQIDAAGLKTAPHAFADSSATALEAAQEMDFPLKVSLVPRQDQVPPNGVHKKEDDGVLKISLPETAITGAPALLYNLSDLKEWVEQQLEIHSDKMLLLERAQLGWQRFEAIVLQDGGGNQVVAAMQAYLEPTGVPAGDAAWIQPPTAIQADLIDALTRTSLKLLKGTDLCGVAALTLGVDPVSGTVSVLDLALGNSRNIAFAAAASGYPLFEMAARLALDISIEAVFPQAVDTPATVAIRLPAAPHSHFKISDSKQAGHCQSMGDAMGVGNDFSEAFFNALEAYPSQTTTPSQGKPPQFRISGAQRYNQIQTALAAGSSAAALVEQAGLAPWVAAALSASTAKASLPAGAAAPFVRVPLKNDLPGAFFRWQRLSEYMDGCKRSKKRLILLIAGRPNAIGQSRELDLAATQSTAALKASDCEVMVLACDPLSAVLHASGEILLCLGGANLTTIEAIDRLWPIDGVMPHCAPGVLQPLTADLTAAGFEVLGTSSRALTLLTSPLALHERLTALGIPHPRCSLASDLEAALNQAEAMGYPLLLRPLTPEGGEAALAGGNTSLIMNPEMLTTQFRKSANADLSFLLEEFIEFAIEVTADALCDGASAAVPQVVEHLELAGIHPGDSAWVIPPYSTPLRHLDTITEYLRKIAIEFELKGFLSGRFAFFNDTVYLLSVDLAFSRTAAMVSDACGLPMFEAATRMMLGASLEAADLSNKHHGRFCIRDAVFPISMEAKLASRLGPVMQSTGEVMGRAESFGMAYYKSQEAAGDRLPIAGGVLITVTDADKPSIIEPARLYREMGFRLLATRGTAAFLQKNGITVETVRKLGMGRPDLVDAIKTGQVDLVINTPSGHQGQMDDSYIRKAAISYNLPYVSTPAGALAAAKGIAARRRLEAKSAI